MSNKETRKAAAVAASDSFFPNISRLDQAPMEENPKISTRYDYASIARPEVDFPKGDPSSVSMTNQSDRDSADINKIMARYEKTGLITDLLGNQRPPMYGDFTGIGDYHQLRITLARADEAFNALPATIRDQFKNDPSLLIEFLSDPKNNAEAIKLGLRPREDNPAGSEATPPGGAETQPAPTPVQTTPPSGGGAGVGR